MAWGLVWFGLLYTYCVGWFSTSPLHTYGLGWCGNGSFMLSLTHSALREKDNQGTGQKDLSRSFTTELFPSSEIDGSGILSHFLQPFPTT